MASIKKLPSGHYRVRWRTHDGKEQGATVPTKRLADQLRAKVELETAAGIYRDPRAGRRHLAGYLADSLETSDELRAATRELYEGTARRYVIPRLGSKPLAAIDAADLRRLYADLKRSGVGPSTIEIVHRLISRVLAQAVDDGLIASNPAARAKAPRAKRKPIRVLTLDEILPLAWVVQRSSILLHGAGKEVYWREFHEETLPKIQALPNDEARLQAFRSSRLTSIGIEGYGVLVLTALFSGLRFQELAGLRRSRIKFGSSPRIEVVEALTEVRGHLEFGPTKTTGSRRAVPLPDKVAEILQQHVDSIPDRIMVLYGPRGNVVYGPNGPRFVERPNPAEKHNDPDPLVFTTERGYPLSYGRFRGRVWAPAARALDFDPIPTFHHLRHSYAAWLIHQGTHPKELQELMGHTSIRTTLDLYGHMMETLGSRQSERMNDALRANGGTYVARNGPEAPAAGR